MWIKQDTVCDTMSDMVLCCACPKGSLLPSLQGTAFHSRKTLLDTPWSEFEARTFSKIARATLAPPLGSLQVREGEKVKLY